MAFLIADNRLTENSSWDDRMLGEQLKILSELELDFDLESIGFEVPEIDLLIDGLNTVPEADPDDRLPDVSESPITVSGDLLQLGKEEARCCIDLEADRCGPEWKGIKSLRGGPWHDHEDWRAASRVRTAKLSLPCMAGATCQHRIKIDGSGE
jgi:hypothetical protein